MGEAVVGLDAEYPVLSKLIVRANLTTADEAGVIMTKEITTGECSADVAADVKSRPVMTGTIGIGAGAALAGPLTPRSAAWLQPTASEVIATVASKSFFIG